MYKRSCSSASALQSGLNASHDVDFLECCTYSIDFLEGEHIACSVDATISAKSAVLVVLVAV